MQSIDLGYRSQMVKPHMCDPLINIHGNFNFLTVEIAAFLSKLGSTMQQQTHLWRHNVAHSEVPLATIKMSAGATKIQTLPPQGWNAYDEILLFRNFLKSQIWLIKT